MGVKKENQHKATRFGTHGFREALCPACQRWTYVFSYQDDTRWRYGKHTVLPTSMQVCDMTGELLPRVQD